MASPPTVSNTDEDAHQLPMFTDFGSKSQPSIQSGPKDVDIEEDTPATNKRLYALTMPAEHYEKVTANKETRKQRMSSGKRNDKEKLDLQIQPMPSSNERRESLSMQNRQSKVFTAKKAPSGRKTDGEYTEEQSRASVFTSSPTPLVSSAPKDVMRIEYLQDVIEVAPSKEILNLENPPMPSSNERRESLSMPTRQSEVFTAKKAPSGRKTDGEYTEEQSRTSGFTSSLTPLVSSAPKDVMRLEYLQDVIEVPSSRQKQMDIFKRENATLVKKIDDQMVELKKARDKELSMETEIEQQRNECIDLREKEKSLKKEVEQLEKECIGLKKCNHVRSSALNKKQSELDKRRKDLKSLQTTIKKKDECLGKYNDALRKYKQSISDLELEKSHMEVELKLQTERFYKEEEQISMLKEEKEKTGEEIQKSSDENKRLNKKLLGMDVQIQRLEGNAKALGEKNRRQEETIQNLIEDKSRLNKVLLGKDEKIQSLGRNAKDLDIEKKRQEETIQNLMEEKSRLNKVLLGKDEQIQRTDKEIQKSSDENERLNKVLLGKDEKIKSLRRNAKELFLEKKRQEETIQNLMKEKSRWEEKAKALGEENKSNLKEDLDEELKVQAQRRHRLSELFEKEKELQRAAEENNTMHFENKGDEVPGRKRDVTWFRKDDLWEQLVYE